MSQRPRATVKPFLFVASLILFILSILAGLELWHGLHQVMVHIFLLFGLILILRHVVLLYAAWRRNRELPIKQSITDYPFISIIIPAYNEEAVIKESLSSLLLLDYPKYEVIMVDDGSSDNTVIIAKDIEQEHSTIPLRIITQNFIRRGLSWLGIVTVIPGPVGLFRKLAMDEIGGYSEDKNLFAEDADLTVRLLAKGYQIVSEDRIVASTEAPVEVYPLLRQRYRWKRGIYQTLHLNFRELILAANARQTFIAIFLVMEGFFMEIISFSITLFILASFFRFAELQLLYAWFGLLFGLDLLVLMFAVGKNWWKAIPLLFFSKLISDLLT